VSNLLLVFEETVELRDKQLPVSQPRQSKQDEHNFPNERAVLSANCLVP